MNCRLRRIGPNTSADVSIPSGRCLQNLLTLFLDCGELGHGSENRCDPEKKAAFAAAKAAEEGGNTFDNGDNNGFDTAADSFNSAGATTDAWATNGAPSGQSTWENTPVTAAAGGW